VVRIGSGFEQVDGHAVGDVGTLALVHCFSSTITALSEPVFALLPVTRTSRRFEECDSFSSARMPWSRRSSSWSAFDVALSELCHASGTTRTVDRPV